MSTVSDDQDADAAIDPPTGGSRRVSVFVALPVILGCAVFGSIIGVTHPLRSFFPGESRGGEVADLRLASLKLVETPPVEPRKAPENQKEADKATDKPIPGERPVQSEQPPPIVAASVASHAQSPAPSAVVSVGTGSVDRAPSPPSEDATPVVADNPEVARSGSPSRASGHNLRMARAKRLRRVLWRRTRVRPPGSEVDAFFSSLLTTSKK